MTEQVRISPADLIRLEGAAEALRQSIDGFSTQRIGDVLGKLEAAFSFLEERQEEIGEFLGIEPGSAAASKFRQTIEETQGALTGGDVALAAAERFGALRALESIPGGESVANATRIAIAAAGAEVGRRIGAGQEQRRIDAERFGAEIADLTDYVDSFELQKRQRRREHDAIARAAATRRTLLSAERRR